MDTTTNKQTIQQILNKIQVELKAPKDKRNTFGNYSYRNAEDILEAVKPLLDGAILTISDEVVTVGEGSPIVVTVTESYKDKAGETKFQDMQKVIGGERIYVKATVTITYEGSSISTTAYARESQDKKGMDDSQITGATSSYARKYALNGLFCIDDTKDADSMDNTKPTITKKPVVTTPRETTVEEENAEIDRRNDLMKQIEVKYYYALGLKREEVHEKLKTKHKVFGIVSIPTSDLEQELKEVIEIEKAKKFADS